MKAETEAAEGEDVPKVMVRSGTGVYKLDDNEYEGAWKDDKMHGKGQLKFMKGSLYWVIRSGPPNPVCTYPIFFALSAASFAPCASFLRRRCCCWKC